MKKLPHPKQPEGPVTVRMSPELQTQLDLCAQKTGLKVTDLMRLCMRIGIEHFARIDYDTAKCIVDAVEKKDKTEPRFEIKEIISAAPQPKASLIAKAEADLVKSEACAENVTSNATSPTSSPASPKTANIVPLPKPPMMRTAAPQLPSKVAEDPPKPPRKKNGTED